MFEDLFWQIFIWQIIIGVVALVFYFYFLKAVIIAALKEVQGTQQTRQQEAGNAKLVIPSKKGELSITRRTWTGDKAVTLTMTPTWVSPHFAPQIGDYEKQWETESKIPRDVKDRLVRFLMEIDADHRRGVYRDVVVDEDGVRLTANVQFPNNGVDCHTANERWAWPSGRRRDAALMRRLREEACDKAFATRLYEQEAAARGEPVAATLPESDS